MAGTQKAVQLTCSAAERDWRNRVFLTSEKPIPYDLAPGDVLVRLKCRSVSNADVMALSGTYCDYNPSFDPSTPGFEGMGCVEKVGISVEKFEVGQRVIPFPETGMAGDGMWQEYLKIKQNKLLHVPDDLPDEAAAQFFNTCTAVGLVDSLKVSPGDFIIQTAAGSTLGRILVAYAKHVGIKTINIARGTHHFQYLKLLGAEAVIDCEKENILKRVMEITDGKLAYAAVDAVAGDMTAVCAQCVRVGGSVVVYGALSGMDCSYFVKDILFRNVQFKGFHLMKWFMMEYHDEAERLEFFKKVMKLQTDGVLKPLVGPRFDLEHFKNAVEELLRPPNVGKVLIVG